MKFTLALSAMIALGGCTHGTRESSDLTKKGGPGGDSPIVVSDGSTILKHKGSNHDFRLSASAGNLQTTIDTATTVMKLKCVSGAFSGCPDGTLSSNLQGNWSVAIYDQNDVNVLNLAPQSNSAQNTVVIATFPNGIQADVDEVDTNDPDSPQGTKITHGAHTFKYLKFVNNGGASVTYTCGTPTKCKIKIIY